MFVRLVWISFCDTQPCFPDRPLSPFDLNGSIHLCLALNTFYFRLSKAIAVKYTRHALTGFYVSVTMSCQCLCFERFPRRLFKFSSYSIGTLLQLLRRNLLRLVFKIVPSYIVRVFCCQVGNNVLHWNTTMNIAWLAICHLLFSFECGGVFSLTICWCSKPYRPWCILMNLFSPPFSPKGSTASQLSSHFIGNAVSPS